MDLMLLDVVCTDTQPATISTLSGPDTTFEEPEEKPNEALVLLFGRKLDGVSVCLTLKSYRPWARIILKDSTVANFDASKVKGLVLEATGLSGLDDFANVSVKLEKLPKFYGFYSVDSAIKLWTCFKVYLPTFASVGRFESIWRFKQQNSFANKMNAAKKMLLNNFEISDEGSVHATKALNELGLKPSAWFNVLDKSWSPRISTCKEHYCCTLVCGNDAITAVAPIKIVSFDAEMFSNDGSFPEVIKGDIAVAICASVYVYGQKELERHAFVIWSPETAGPLKTLTEGLIIHYTQDPIDLLDEFRDFIVETDPDLLTGWNIFGFDMPFMWDSYAANYTLPSKRGSEELHKECLKSLKKSEDFLSVKDLLALRKKSLKACGHSAKPIIDALDIRWKMVLSQSPKLPELLASEVRKALRSDLALGPEKFTVAGPEDFAALKHLCGLKMEPKSFQEVMAVPKYGFSERRFERLGRLASEKSTLIEKRMASSARGDNTYYFWSGRPCIDLMNAIKDDKKLDSNTLKFVAQTFLDPEFGKLDMTPAEMFAAWRAQDAVGIASMLDYCMRDADIPNMLIERLGYVPIWIEKSRVTCTPIQQLLNGGQQRSIYNLLSQFVHNVYALNKGQSGWPTSTYDDDDANDDSQTIMEDSMKKRRPDYKGATVIEPTPGYYTAPDHPCVSTLDFESLYPSIMVHFNLCPSVFVGTNVLEKLPGFITETHEIEHAIRIDPKTNWTYGTAYAINDAVNHKGRAYISLSNDNSRNLEESTFWKFLGPIDAAGHAGPDLYNEFTNTYTFVKNVQGVIPKLLQHLLRARKVAKRAMAQAPDEYAKAIQNGRQLALKTSCNSVYGFFGVSPGKALCSFKPASAVTTKWGRNFLEHAKTYVEAHYTGSKVLYGDTDSIMISFGPTVVDVVEAYKLADEASSAITELLRSGSIGSKPSLESAACAVTLANEKVYTSFLLIQKKMYAALKFSLKSGHQPVSIEDFESCIDMKGIDAVRRDRSKLVKMLSESILEALLVKKDLGLALGTLKSTLNQVAELKAPLDWLVLSKSLKSTYASENQPHVKAWKRMIARGATNAPDIGSRMPYIITSAKSSNVPLYERTEHPDYVESAKLKYCTKYYLENARDVIERLLGPTGRIGEVSKLFSDALIAGELKTSGQMTLKQFFGQKRQLE